MPLRQTQDRELTDEEALAYLTGAQGQQGAERELSDEEAMAYLTGAPGASGGKAPPGPLSVFGGQLLGGFANVAGAGKVLAEDMAGAVGLPREAPFFGGMQEILQGASESLYPPETRGRGSFWGETIPGALGSTGATVASGLVGGPGAAMISAGGQIGYPMHQEILEKTGDRKKALLGLGAGAALAPLEAMTGAGGALMGLGKKLAGRGLLEVGKTILKTAGSEVAEEVVEQVITDSLLESLTGEDKQILQNALDTIGPSAVVGTLFGGGRVAIEQMGAKAPAEEEAPATPIEDLGQPKPPLQATLQGVKQDLAPSPTMPPEAQAPPATGDTAAGLRGKGQGAVAPGLAQPATSPPQTGRRADDTALPPTEVVQPRRRALDLRPEDEEARAELKGLAEAMGPAIEQKGRADAKEYEAEHDARTGLLNVAGDERWSPEIVKAAKKAGMRVWRIFFDNRDVDSMNALLGHDVTDVLLQSQAAAWRGSARDTDALSRVGGDEFAGTIMLPEGVTPESIADRMERQSHDALVPLGLDVGVLGRRFGGDAGWAEVDLNADPKEALAAANKAAAAHAKKRKTDRNPGKAKLTNEQKAALGPGAKAERDARLAALKAGAPPAEPVTAPLQPDEMTAEQMAPKRKPSGRHGFLRQPDREILAEAGRVIDEGSYQPWKNKLASDVMGVFVGSPSGTDWLIENRPDEARAMYAAFEPVRAKLRAKYGDTITLWRAQGSGEESATRGGRKMTLNYASQQEARRYIRKERVYDRNLGHKVYDKPGRQLTARRVNVEDIVAVNHPGKSGGYEEYIVLHPDATDADRAVLRGELDKAQMAPDKAPTPEEPKKTTGIANKVVEKELAEMGLPPPTKQEAKSDVERHARAKERFEQKDRPAEKLLDSLEGKPRAVSDEDAALLTFEANRLKQERRAAQDAFNEDPSEENGKAVAKAQAAYSRAADIFDAIGAESGRSLRARRMMLNEDYSLAQMERELQVSKGGEELTAKERSTLAKVQKDLEAATARADASELKVAQLEAERALAKLKRKAAKLPVEKPPKNRRSAIEKTKKEIEDIYRRMGERSKNRVHSGSGFGPDDVPDLVLLAGKHIKLGVQTFDAWAAEVVARLGEGIRPHLQGAWNEAQKAKGESKQKAARTRLENEIKETERRIAEKDFTVKERKPLQADPETVRLRAKAEGLRREFRQMKRRAERAARTSSQKIADALREVASSTKEIAPNYDFGAVGTQGAFFALTQPFKTVRHMARSFNAFGTEERALQERQRLMEHPLYETVKQGGMPMYEWDSDLSDGETHIGSWVAKKFPFLKNFNRSFAVFMNVQRWEKAYEMLRSGWDAKHPPSMKDVKRLTQNIGVLSGRGSLGKANAAMDSMNSIFFSARKMVGNIQAAIGTPLWYGGYRHKKAFAKQYVRAAAGFASLATLAAMAAEAYGVDFEVGKEETSPNFGKIKFGDKWYDPWGGLSQAFVFVARLAEGKRTDASGKVTQLRGPKASYKGYALTVADYGRSKLGPTPGWIADVVTGKDWREKAITPLESAKEHFLPMTPYEYYKALKEAGFKEATAEFISNVFGVRVRDYARTSR